jgi:ribosome-associated protein
MTLPIETLDHKQDHSSRQTSSSTPEAPAKPKRRRIARFEQDDIPVGALSHSQPDRVERAKQHSIACARLSDDNRARDVLVLDLQNGTSVVDYFVIASVVSRRQASALASDIDAEMKRAGEKKLGIEGAQEGRWILIDYGDFVVHVFSEDARAYYGLDELWGDAPRVEWQSPVKAEA